MIHSSIMHHLATYCWPPDVAPFMAALTLVRAAIPLLERSFYAIFEAIFPMAEENTPQSAVPDAGPVKSETALREEAVLSYWKEKDIFAKTLAKESPKGEFVFYDGPPFATGLPHYGSLLPSIIKDVIPRYKTMHGFHVDRRWGWDCHGLPIESIIEKKLGLKTKKAIEAMGVEAFNEAARSVVLEFVADWKQYIDRVGRFVDFDHSYKTMDNSYIESVWWGLKKISDKGRLYEGRKVLMYCVHDETPLAKAEIAMDNTYEDVTEEAVTVKFRIKNPDSHDLPENAFLLAWTTTPWTLPGNVALAVGSAIDYGEFESKETKEVYILASALAAAVLGADWESAYTKNKEYSGRNLLNMEYEPLYVIPKIEGSGKKSHYVAAADFVTTTEGTGIVHTAVMYGEDDYALGQKIDLPAVQLLTPNGTFNEDAPAFVIGKYFKWHARGVCPVQKGEDAETFIKAELTERALLFAKAPRTHSYPHCYRCGTPLIYNAISSWFINVQEIKHRMLELNQNINWVPDHLKHGRFGNIVENAPDWTISRNRYWASPLPIWKNPATGKVVVIGSVEELRARAKKSGNRYFRMRHGEAESNVAGIMSTNVDNPHELTVAGKAMVQKSAEALLPEKIDLIITSPFMRTRQTAEIVRAVLGLPDAAVIVDDRLREISAGVFEGKPISEYRARSLRERMYHAPEGGESLAEVGARSLACLFDLEGTHAGKNILIISHGSPLLMIDGYTRFLDSEGILNLYEGTSDNVAHAECHEIPFFPYPHRANFEPDLHRPYIDAVPLLDDDGSQLVRIPEVVDCWLESGSMPFASEHYPFENEDRFEKRFPGDFISEYIAQTRTWFYYMHVMGIQLFDKQSFRSVVSTGTILAADGAKMSKSKGNYTDPMANLDRFGADALRAYLMGSVVMQSEDIRFNDDEVREMHNRLIGMLWNAYKFYELQKGEEVVADRGAPSTHVLDRWLLARLASMGQEVTHYLDLYDTVRAVRSIRAFIEDFSTWYVRRSRDRFKGDDMRDRDNALMTTALVLREFSKYIAPLMPFIAENIYQGTGGKLESVHLESWPEVRLADQESLMLMGAVREVVSKALEARAASGIKIRQPLPKLTIRSEILIEKSEYLDLIKDELNVKEVKINRDQAEDVLLDTTISNELLEEGAVRDLLRLLQQTRKLSGMAPGDSARLLVDTTDAGYAFLKKHQSELERVAGVSEITTVPLEEELPQIDLFGHTIRYALIP